MLDLGYLISSIKQWHPKLGVILEQMQDAVNSTAKNIAVDPTAKYPTPPPLDAIDVKAAGGVAHVVLTHNSPIDKHVLYHVEADTDPSFPQPHVVVSGSYSRTHFVTQPSINDNGDTQHWYFRAFPQYHGSDPAEPTVFGGRGTPTPVNTGGGVMLTPLPSTGSGTAAPNGQQGGQGIGVDQHRLPLLK